MAARANVWSDDSCTKGQYRPGRSAVMVRCLTGAAPTARTHDAWSLRDGSPGHSPSPRRWPGLFFCYCGRNPSDTSFIPRACGVPSWSSLNLSGKTIDLRRRVQALGGAVAPRDESSVRVQNHLCASRCQPQKRLHYSIDLSVRGVQAYIFRDVTRSARPRLDLSLRRDVDCAIGGHS